MSETLAAQIMRRLAAMESKRLPHEQVWRDCFDYSFPERGDGFSGEKNDATALQAKRARLMDATSTDSGQILAAALMSGGTPSNSRWFGMSTGQDSDEEERWFDLCAEILFENIHGSNYDAVGFEACTDMIPAGWFVMFIGEDPEGGYHFELWPLAACFIAASKAGGLPDTLVRKYRLSAEQAVNDFGEDKVPPKIRQAMEDKEPDKAFEFCQYIYPRAKQAAGVRAKNLPFASCHVELESKMLVRESGFHECPFVAPRWSKLPDSDYAVGPMFRALPDVKQLNRLVQMEDTGMDLAISGMWIAEDDGVLNPRTVKVGPRKIIVANSVDSMKPLMSGAKFDLSFTKKDQLQASIRKTLMSDQLAPQDGPVRTATEIHVRVQQIRQLLGPIYGRLQAEWYQPMINRCFGIALRVPGLLPPPPQSLVDRNYNVVFVSPMAKAQKMEEVNAVETSLAAVGQIAVATQSADVWDTIDIEESVNIILEGRGAPARVGRSKEDIAVIREARAQAQQQAQQQQQQAEMAQKVAPQMANNSKGA